MDEQQQQPEPTPNTDPWWKRNLDKGRAASPSHMKGQPAKPLSEDETAPSPTILGMRLVRQWLEKGVTFLSHEPWGKTVLADGKPRMCYKKRVRPLEPKEFDMLMKWLRDAEAGNNPALPKISTTPPGQVGRPPGSAYRSTKPEAPRTPEQIANEKFRINGTKG